MWIQPKLIVPLRGPNGMTIRRRYALRRFRWMIALTIAGIGLFVVKNGPIHAQQDGHRPLEGNPIVAPFPQPPTDSDDQEPHGFYNWNLKTLGGMQFWTDVRIVGDWKIQRHSQTGHYRLLNPDSVRFAWGNLDHCNQELDQRIKAGVVIPYRGKVVILLHGLMRTNNAMTPVADFLAATGEYTPINFQYASSRETVAIHADDLRQVIEGLGDEVTEINFVGHSLGNIVVRHYLGDLKRAGVKMDSRIHRMVMYGPPNQGSGMARVLKNSFLFKTLAGASGAQLSLDWDRLESQLATPEFPFGIVAGGQETDTDFSNFILKGRDDFTVAVDETKLGGAADLLVRPLVHSTMMNQPEIHEATLRFLNRGYFLSEQERRPIPADWQHQ